MVIADGELKSLLGAEFDLGYQPKLGDESYYRVDASYRLLTTQGLVTRRDSYLGDVHRVVDSVGAAGATETLAWRNIVTRWSFEDEPYEKPEPIEWAEGLTYTFSPEIGMADLNEQAKPFPRDMLGWNVLLLAIDTHVEFDYPRFEQGGIKELRRIGDAHTPPPKTGGGEIDFSPFINATFGGTRHETRFVGLTRCNGEPCALLESDIPDRVSFDMTMGETIWPSSSSLRRTIVFRLSDGALEHGTSVEWVCANGMWINPIYTIERITGADYERGIA